VYKRQSNKLAPPELKAVHPLGKSPLVTIAASSLDKPIVLAESAAICEYLCDHFAPHLVPTRYREGFEGKVGGETEQWLRYRFYMHYAEGSLMSLLTVAMIMDSKFSSLYHRAEQNCFSYDQCHKESALTKLPHPDIRNSPVPFFIKPVTRGIADKVDSMYLNANYETHFGFLNSQLATSPDNGEYLCGASLTAADILMSFPIIAASGKVDAQKYPKLKAYAAKLEAHPGYVNCVKKIEELTGMPFELRP
jgi:glutathione S-transferase